MNRHTPSFFVSVLVHAFLAVLVFGTYKYVVKIGTIKKEERVCVQLNCLSTKQKQEKKELDSKAHKVKKKQKQKKQQKKKKIPPTPKIKPQVKPPIKQEEKTKTISMEEPTQVLVDTKPVDIEIQTNTKTKEEVYKEHHLEKIIELLSENLYYPRSARKRGIEGVVEISFVLDTDANTKEIQIISSQSDILSRAAIKTIHNLSGAFPKPKEDLRLHIPIAYKLK